MEPAKPSMALAEMHQVNGLGKVTAEVGQLHMQVLFKKVRQSAD